MKIFGSISELVDLAFRLAGGKQVKIRSNPQTTTTSNTITVNVPDVAASGDTQNMVLTAAAQSLSNKTLASPSIVNSVVAGVPPTSITGAQINQSPIGQGVGGQAAGSFTTLSTSGTATLQNMVVSSFNGANDGILHSTNGTGVITSSKIVNADIADLAAIDFDKLENAGVNTLVAGNNSGITEALAMYAGSDLTLSTSTGALDFQLKADVVGNTEIPVGANIDSNKIRELNSIGKRPIVTDAAGLLLANADALVHNELVYWDNTLGKFQSVTGVDNTEAGYLNGLSGNIQTQLSNKQDASAVLSTIADDITPAADKYIYFTGPNDAVAGTITSFGRSLVDDADSTAARSTLGLSSMATQAAGTVAITGGTLSAVTISNADLNDTTSNRLRSAFASAAISSGTLDATKGLMRLLAGGTTLNSITDSTGKLGLSGVNLTLNNYSVGADVIVTNAGNIITGTGEDFVLKQGAAASFVHNGDGKFVLTGGAGSAAGGLTTSPLATTLALAVKNTHYLTNTSGGAFSVTLPAGAAGSVIRFSDANETWDANALTIIPASGEKLDNLATNESLICDVKRGWVELSWNTALSSWSLQSLAATDVVAASATQSGVVTTGAQTFAGDKIFTGNLKLTVPSAGAEGGQLEWYSKDSTTLRTFIDIDGADNTRFFSTGAFPQTFHTNSTERMRIDANGNLLVGATSAIDLAKRIHGENSSNAGQYSARSTSAGAGKWWQFGATSNAFIVYNQGAIGVYMNDGSTSWTANSDERLKKNIQPLELGLSQIKELKPARFDYNSDESESSSRVGFIAQEVLPVLPHAVCVPEDSEQMMGVSATEMIPVLVKAMQEQQVMIEELKARLDSLES